MSKNNIDYSVRPNKSLVRIRILNIIDKVFRPLHDQPANLSYTTLSGFRFVDSIEYYNRFNNRNIYSIEYDSRLFKRAHFNRPYEFIKIIKGRVADFLDEKYQEISSTRKTIFLDYECRFIDNIIIDLEALFSAGFFNEKSLLFITFNRTFIKDNLTPMVSDIIPEEIDRKEIYENWLKEDFSSFILDKVQKKYSDKKVLKEKLKVFYRDTANMAVFGYLIKDKEENELPLKKIEFESFALPELTFLEENYIRNRLTGEAQEIADDLGLSERDIENYREFV